MNKRMSEGIPILNQDVKHWVKTNVIPKDFKVLLNLAIMDKQNEDAKVGDKLEREELCTGEAIQ